MKKVFSLVVLLIAVGAGFWLYTVLFPNPQQAVRNHLNKVARLASFSPSDGNLSRMANVERLGTLFARDVQVVVDIPGYESHTFSNREELMQAAALTKRFAGGLKAEFLDMNIEMGAGNDSALVDLTLKAKVSTESDLIVQELKFTLKKSDGGSWLITRVETIKTLKP
ncbi:MAG TPA: hypothetical protein VH413_08190 [Verrucomicrobiae bacterium]|jgi:hypothetical protein|nr:hypothetical protein [Verrucomicrobiae bacterium]